MHWRYDSMSTMTKLPHIWLSALYLMTPFIPRRMSLVELSSLKPMSTRLFFRLKRPLLALLPRA